ncbi:MAG: hypothetical protein M3Y17_03515 [Actinomycetota bacterium]|nr:hypothetical protein [Actinomycetota bacterium]
MHLSVAQSLASDEHSSIHRAFPHAAELVEIVDDGSAFAAEKAKLAARRAL